jgi:hypothetical protein
VPLTDRRLLERGLYLLGAVDEANLRTAAE